MQPKNKHSILMDENLSVSLPVSIRILTVFSKEFRQIRLHFSPLSNRIYEDKVSVSLILKGLKI